MKHFLKQLVSNINYKFPKSKTIFKEISITYTSTFLHSGLMSSMFRNTDIVPSDFIAGFVLLRVKQKRESREQRRLALLAEQRYNCTSSKYKLN